MSGKIVAGALIVVIATGLCVWGPSKVTAQEPRLWDGDISINPVTYPTDPSDVNHNFCTAQVMQAVNLTNYTRLTGQLISYNAETTETPGAQYPGGCVYWNELGYFGDLFWAPDRLSQAGRMILPAETSRFPVPTSNIVITTKLQGTGGGRTVGVNYNFRPDVVAKLAITTLGSGTTAVNEKSYTIDETKLAQPLKYADANPIIIDAPIGFSANGRYAVVLVQRKGYALIDLQTKAITPFAINRSTSVSGIKFAVMDTGGYVATTQGANSILYDLGSCVTYEYGALPATVFDSMPIGCIGRDVTPIVRTRCAVRAFANRTRFISYGSQLSLDPQCNNPDGTFTTKRFYLSPSLVDITVYEPKGYLALGDSFSSGEGDTEGREWYEPGTDEGGDQETYAGRNLCHVSRRSYPYLIAKQLNYLPGLPAEPVTPADSGLFHSVACSGAVIHNVIGAIGEKHDDGDALAFAVTDNQYRYDSASLLQQFTPGNEKQVGYLQSRERADSRPRQSLNPEVITLGIGGNDAAFGNFISACVLPGTCEFSESGSLKQKQFIMRIAHNKDRLVKTYKSAKLAAPNTRIYVHGYPEFLQQSGGDCGLNVFLDAQERFFAVEAIRYMNDVVQAAAAEAGVFYVDVEGILAGVNLCSGKDIPDIAFNGVTAGNDIDPVDGTFLQNAGILPSGICIGECVGKETYHPNFIAHELYTLAIAAQTTNLTAPMPAPMPQVTPSPNESYFGLEIVNDIWLINNPDGSSYVPFKSPAVYAVNVVTNSLDISVNNLMPATEARLVIQSEPLEIGRYTVSADGTLRANITLPVNLEPGYHELHLYAIRANGVRVDLYESLIVGAAVGDFDGDGILDNLDSCKMVVNSAIDADQDDLDDACDSVVVPIPPVDSPPDDPPPDEPPDEDPPPDEPPVAIPPILGNRSDTALEVLRRVFTDLLVTNTPGLSTKESCVQTKKIHPIICRILID